MKVLTTVVFLRGQFIVSSDLRPFCFISANFAADAVHFGENIATSNLKAMLGVNETGAGYAFYYCLLLTAVLSGYITGMQYPDTRSR